MEAVAADRLLERGVELTRLGELIDSARRGAGRLAVIEGPAGIGKSRLLAAARESAADAGITVLAARGGELEREFPFGMARQLLEAPVASAPAKKRQVLLAGAAAHALTAVGPPDARERAGGDTAPSFAVLHGLYWLLANLSAEQPQLLAVDDAHWVDPPTLRWLEYLVRRLEELPVLVLLTARPAEPGADAELLSALLLDPATALIRPEPLSADAVGELLNVAFESAAEPDFRRACHEVTGGNPFLLHELVGVLSGDRVAPTAESAARVSGLGPAGISRAVLARIARLSPSAVSLAQAVAILGDRVELRTAARLAEIDEAEAAKLADELAAVDVLARGRPLEFVHAIVRAAIYADMPASAREGGHARAARLLAEADVDAVAAHLLATEPRGEGWVVERLSEAAERAMARGAPDVAAANLARALAEPPAPDARAEVLVALATAESRAGDPACVEHFGDALTEISDPLERAPVALALGAALVQTGQVKRACEVFEGAASELGEEQEISLELDAAAMVTARMFSSRAGGAETRLSGTRERLEGRSRAERAALAALAWQAAMAGDPVEEARELAQRSLAGGRLLREDGTDAPAFGFAVTALAIADGMEEADAALAAAMDEARRRGSVSAFAMASTVRAWVALRRGLVNDAAAHAQATLDIVEQQGWPFGRPLALAWLADSQIECGELKDAEATLARLPLEPGMARFAAFSHLFHVRGRLRALKGAVEEGLEDLLACGEGLESWGATSPAAVAWRSEAALAALRLGELDRARTLAEEDLELARRAGSSRAIGVALRAAGLVEGGEAGIELLGEAVEALADSPARLEHARALVDLGTALRHAGRRKEARQPLGEGLKLARACGATALAARAHEELVATGARPRKIVRGGVEALTPSERRIAQMAAEGMSNREIAQALFVTVRTVEVHLSHAYQKLDISSRRELPAAFTEA